eukprot:TRINITY_DN4069_c0_g1_i4.p1 TRINITY_DN4069_c0_g1~~TRINITY_DN4069_c0_g1_i4.p1  ORF type:complete len:327 (-),score=39.40 TRINITY_DN4069_c0_g1_i4:125-1105(-)
MNLSVAQLTLVLVVWSLLATIGLHLLIKKQSSYSLKKTIYLLGFTTIAAVNMLLFVNLKEVSLFQILEVTRISTPGEVRQTYKKKLVIYHPDTETGSEEKFLLVRKALEFMGDAKMRSFYDRYGDFLPDIFSPDVKKTIEFSKQDDLQRIQTSNAVFFYSMTALLAIVLNAHKRNKRAQRLSILICIGAGLLEWTIINDVNMDQSAIYTMAFRELTVYEIYFFIRFCLVIPILLAVKTYFGCFCPTKEEKLINELENSISKGDTPTENEDVMRLVSQVKDVLSQALDDEGLSEKTKYKRVLRTVVQVLAIVAFAFMLAIIRFELQI